MSEKILVVEDELSLRETLIYNLQHQGYRVDSASDGYEAIDKAIAQKPDLILLDIMLPGVDGFEVCRTLRQSMNVPIIFLSARDDEIDRVIGLEIGGDDYITKPFSMRELMSRVKARLRLLRMLQRGDLLAETSSPEEDLRQVFVFNNLSIDEKRREITLDGSPIAYKPKEYELLLFLAKHARRLVTREEVLNQVWGYDFIGDTRTVDVHVRWLREKIEKDPSHPTRIVTVRGGGYRFEG
jgi:DNA-binding response OmpR family regulator